MPDDPARKVQPGPGALDDWDSLPLDPDADDWDAPVSPVKAPAPTGPAPADDEGDWDGPASEGAEPAAEEAEPVGVVPDGPEPPTPASAADDWDEPVSEGPQPAAETAEPAAGAPGGPESPGPAASTDDWDGPAPGKGASKLDDWDGPAPGKGASKLDDWNGPAPGKGASRIDDWDGSALLGPAVKADDLAVPAPGGPAAQDGDWGGPALDLGAGSLAAGSRDEDGPPFEASRPGPDPADDEAGIPGPSLEADSGGGPDSSRPASDTGLTRPTAERHERPERPDPDDDQGRSDFLKSLMDGENDAVPQKVELDLDGIFDQARKEAERLSPDATSPPVEAPLAGLDEAPPDEERIDVAPLAPSDVRKVARYKMLIVMGTLGVVILGLLFALYRIFFRSVEPPPQTRPFVVEPDPLLSTRTPMPGELALGRFYMTLGEDQEHAFVEMEITLHYQDAPDLEIIKAENTLIRDIIYRLTKPLGPTLLTDPEIRRQLQADLLVTLNNIEALRGDPEEPRITYVQISLLSRR